MSRFLSVVLIVLVSVISLSGKTEALSIVMEQWDIRGKVADSKLTELLFELEAMKMPHRGHERDPEILRRIVGEIALESAYSHHLKVPEGVQKVIDGGMEFHLTLNAADRGMFDLVYVYSDAGEIQSSSIAHLPSGWSVRLPTEDHPVMFVTTHIGEVYSFNLEKPFEALYWGE